MPKINGESFIQLDFGWFCRGFNNCSRDRSSSQLVAGRVLKVWKIFTTVFFNVFSIFLWYLLSYVVNRSTSALHLFELFCCEPFFPPFKAYKHLPYSNYININSKGLTWYGFKTFFYTTFMYLCMWYHVIL